MAITLVSTRLEKAVSNQLVENQNLMSCSKEKLDIVCSFTLKCLVVWDREKLQ